ncbi:P-loop containing nucleoside triphosphate hydrolase protein [Dendrothele bispora CBS 962.96]|uniref:DNA 3'-5' helicase n=1 Tax=Dendrothele bispora (strain CBS 962.96) TaxID=1314807 RepID=A0A4S8LKL6_DENBC|nr:P-loop containing nucleoside triphosphate hydrolase protein [Dendrothele bispora CBS 962.96]
MQTRGYNSTDTRNLMQATFTQKFGKPAYDWQLNVSEALILGLDCIVVAGTGSGKTIPFMLPLLGDDHFRILVISPLKILQQDQANPRTAMSAIFFCKQVTRFAKLGIKAVAINGDTWKRKKLREDLKNGVFHAMFLGPEMLLEHEGFRDFMREHNILKNIAATVIDEAHCISQWSGDFRKTYGKLEKVRSLLSPGTPLLATSATLCRASFMDIQSKLLIDAEEAFLLNLGNDRFNISTSVHKMNHAEDYEALLLHVNLKASTLDELDKTIVFVNTVRPTLKACRYLRDKLHPNLHSAVDYLHSYRSSRDKRKIMRRFRQGGIRILIATEAAGMGADIPDIKVGIQFGVPPSLTVLKQRLGRIGRNTSICASGVVLVEKSMFQAVKKRRNKTSSLNTFMRQCSNTARADLQ